jgi:hypothetical protein
MATKKQVETWENEGEVIGLLALLRVLVVLWKSIARERPPVVLMDKSVARGPLLCSLRPWPVHAHPPSLSLQPNPAAFFLPHLISLRSRISIA